MTQDGFAHPREALSPNPPIFDFWSVAMDRQVLLTKSGQAEQLDVLGAHVRFLCEAADTGQAFSLMEVLLPRDAGPPPHDHDWDEAYYVTRGSVEFDVAGRKTLVKAGDFLYVPGKTLHGFRGAGEEAAQMLIFDAPAHAGAFFREVDRTVKGPEQLPLVPGIGLRHGIRFAPPPAA